MKNDRYLIYEMLDKQISFYKQMNKNKVNIKGVVSDVYRDIIEGNIEITISGVKNIFREPNAIYRSDKFICFCYGNVEDMTDDKFFKEFPLLAEKGMGVDEALKELNLDNTYMFFEVSDAPIGKKRKNKRKLKVL